MNRFLNGLPGIKRTAFEWKKYRRTVGIVLVLFGMAFCHQMAEASYEEGETLWGDLVQLRMNEEQITADQVEQMIQTEAKEEQRNLLTAWFQKREATVENRILGRETELDLVFYFGDNTSPFGLNLENGIALSKDQTYELWGADEVIGETVFIDDREYVVEKLLDSSEKMGIARLSRDTDETFSVLDVHLADDSIFDTSVEQLISGYGLNISTEITYKGYLEGVKRAGTLPVWIFTVLVCAGFIKKAFQSRKKWINSVLWLTSACFSIWCCSLFFDFPMEIPQAFVPTRWSDFSFWSEAFNQMKQYVRQTGSMEKFIFDGQIKAVLFQILSWGLLGNLCLTILIRRTALEIGKGGKQNGVHILEQYREKIFRYGNRGKGL